MLPILLIHGYSAEGKNASVESIYGTLPGDLRALFGPEVVLDLDLSRYLSLNNGVSIDDISFAMDRALRQQYPDLLKAGAGFYTIVHSTGALVVRNWIRLFDQKPSHVQKIVHLAGANFGSGWAHIGQGQLSRWRRQIFYGTGVGTLVLKELELGSWKTMDLNLHFLQPGQRMFQDYKTQEFCVIGSGSRKDDPMRLLPVRYAKEDSSDNTVRTSACNLNFNHIRISPKDSASGIDAATMSAVVTKRLQNRLVDDQYHAFEMRHSFDGDESIPFALLYETTHFNDENGVLFGKDNRDQVLPLLKAALTAPQTAQGYADVRQTFQNQTAATFGKAADLKNTLLSWNMQQQYEGHAQLTFRLRDQYGNAVEHYDVTIRSKALGKNDVLLESMIEDKHCNTSNDGTITFYLRTQRYDAATKTWKELLKNIASAQLEITGYDPFGMIRFLPVNLALTGEEVQIALQSFRTTVVDVVLLRLPDDQVFTIKKG